MELGFAVLLILASAPREGAPSLPLTERAKVEYVRVEGKTCLQPIVRDKDAGLRDYRDAQLRWLDATYPGLPAPEWQNLLMLPPASSTDPPGKRPVRHASDSAKIVGPHATVEVCFDVNLTTFEPIP